MGIRWDFDRGVLAFMALLIAIGGVFVVWEDRAAAELRQRLPAAERQLAEIGQLAEEVLMLQDEVMRDDVVSGRQKPYVYLEAQQVASHIGKKFKIDAPTSDPHPSEGYEDTRYVLVPNSPNIDFSRRLIASFLLYVEARTTRMKVTRIRLDLSRRKDATRDDWKPQFTITDRHPYREG